MKKIIKTIVFAMVITMFSITFVSAQNNQNANLKDNVVKVYVNGFKVDNLKRVPVEINSNVYLSARDIVDFISAKLQWNNKDKTIRIYNENVDFIAKFGDLKAKLNGKDITLKQKIISIDGVTMLSNDVYKQIFNADVKFDSKGKKLLINSNEKLYDDPSDKAINKGNLLRKSMVSNKFVAEEIKYLTVENVKDDKNLPDGKYFLFKAMSTSKANSKSISIIFYNLYTKDTYEYIIDNLTNGKYDDAVLKYSNRQPVLKYQKNNGDRYTPIVSTLVLYQQLQEKGINFGTYTTTRVARYPNIFTPEEEKYLYFYEVNFANPNDNKHDIKYISHNGNTLELKLFNKFYKIVNL